MKQTSFFFHSDNPSPLMLKVMEKITKQHNEQIQRSKDIRDGKITIEPNYGTWDISDRH